MKRDRIRVTPEKADYVKNHPEKSLHELWKETRLNPPLIELILEVQSNPDLQPQESGPKRLGSRGSHPAYQAIKNKNGIYTTGQCADILGLSQTEMTRRIRDEEIRGRKWKGSWVIRKKDLEKYKEILDEQES